MFHSSFVIASEAAQASLAFVVTVFVETPSSIPSLPESALVTLPGASITMQMMETLRSL